MTAWAGTETYSGKEMKQVAPTPTLPTCDWTGFYLGVHVGGQFGHSEDEDIDGYNLPEKRWGYSESGVVAGGQFGYNWQWRWLVVGPEFDIGYMNLPGRGPEPGSPGGDTHGESDGDFYTTLRGRVGVTLDWQGCWLIYGTGGAIGVNYTTRVIDDCVTGACGPDLLDGRRTDFDWGYTVGGGIERMIGRHWSIKAEYLYYNLDDQRFTARDSGGSTLNWRAETEGHIVRAGLNYKF